MSSTTNTLDRTVGRLLEQRVSGGWWEGQLSTSALSTATASFALHVVDRARRQEGCGPGDEFADLVEGGHHCLVSHQNDDGGWGDTVLSKSNISTTTLCWVALGADPVLRRRHAPSLARAETWLQARTGSLEPARLADAITKVYGKDRTFAVPILTMAALAGRLQTERGDGWELVRPLPFEIASLPHRWYARLGLPVVSYALPALIAIGQARFHHRPGRNPLTLATRALTRRRTLGVLDRIQPSNGGFLEATPLTSFVAMSLAGSGQVSHPVTGRCIDFLAESVLQDGSWPIDTNLATWVTTLSIQALAAAGRLEQSLSLDERRRILDWLLAQQYREVHPYTNAAPGAWAWTDLPGGVPDADDTPGALLAIHHLTQDLDDRGAGTRDSAALGIRWLLALQNRDGGMPTFCRGWGKLPFDRSGADLTAHAARAFVAWRPAMRSLSPSLGARMDRSLTRMIRYLRSQQRADGAWLPLWFGNEHVSDFANPVYGTARVVTAMREISKSFPGNVEDVADHGAAHLVNAQNHDGGWGGSEGAPSSIEETSLAVEALAGRANARESIRRGAAWLEERLSLPGFPAAAPIGFYFANLWYFERLYPMIFSVAALGCVERDEDLGCH